MESMNIHYLQHVPFEDPAHILSWANKKKHSVTSTKLFAHESIPQDNSFDMLIIMGGPMNIYEFDTYPWLEKEYSVIEKAITQNKKVMGICLGAQLIAHVLGAKVYRNTYSEIGWFPVYRTDECDRNGFTAFPPEFTAFHWHGDTFDLPAGSIHLARSEACTNQAFLFNKSVLGLQFHLESTYESTKHLIENCRNDIKNAPYIQQEEEILLLSEKHIRQSNAIMDNILQTFFT